MYSANGIRLDQRFIIEFTFVYFNKNHSLQFNINSHIHATGVSVDGKTLAKSNTETPGTGHFHLFINANDVPENHTIPRNDQYKHYDKGQSETVVFLPPGKFKLTLQLGDGSHRSFGEKYRKTIEINVVPDKD